MDKRYQVFVSSTYEDLRVERQEVMQALLELDCIPAGMELFPAGNEDQWTLIKRVIQECDYYIVISAGKYGSIGKGGQSYTEMEYRFATSIDKPVIAFLHKDIQLLKALQVESTDDGKAKLVAFRDHLQRKICKFWDSPADLGSKVSRSLVQLIKASPAVGWIRADQAADAIAAAEILALRKQVEEVQRKLTEAVSAAPAGSEKLAQGDTLYTAKYSFTAEDSNDDDYDFTLEVDISWDSLFYDVGPIMINEAGDNALRGVLNNSVRERSRKARAEDKALKGFKKLRNFKISDHDFYTIKIQFIALGLVRKSQRQRSLRDASTYWSLTSFGEQRLTTLRAIPATPTSSLHITTEGGSSPVGEEK
jgi:hypothetical protein